MYEDAERGRQVDAGPAVCRDPADRDGASVAQGPGDYRRGGPGDLGRFTRGKRGANGGAVRRVFYAGR